MNPLLLGTLVGTGGNVGLGLLGNWLARPDDDEAQRLLDEAARETGSVNAPTLERLVAEQMGPSAAESLGNDMGNRGARDAAIRALMEEGLAGGESLESKVAQAQGMRAAGQAARQGSATALQSAARRGMGGAASTLQAQLLGASQGADTAAQAGMQGAMDARRNALMALQQGGGMAASAEQADSARELARRQAMDRVAQFNAAQRQEANNYNVRLGQQNFENQLRTSDRRAQGSLMRSGAASQRANQTRQMFGGLGQAAGYAGAAYGAYGRPQQAAMPQGGPGAIGGQAALSQDALDDWRKNYG